MLLRQLELFAAVVDCGSFTGAARRLHVSQSAVSQQVKSLEADLGAELLHRTGRSFALTPAGEAALSGARDLLDRAARLRLDVERAAGGGRRALRVGYLSRYDGWEVQGAVAAFALRHPEVTVDAVAGSHEDLYEMLFTGEVDLAFSDRRRTLSDTAVNEHLVTLYTVVEVSEANPLAAQERVAVSELGDTPCILVAPKERRAAERAYYRDVLNFPCPFVFASTLEEAHMMVAGNRGFLPVETRGPASAAGSIVKRIPLVAAQGQLEREYYAFWPVERTDWAVKEFARILKGLLTPEG